MFLAGALHENPAWDDWWEEFTEFLTMGFLAVFFVLFREQLGIKLPFVRRKAPETGGEGALPA